MPDDVVVPDAPADQPEPTTPVDAGASLYRDNATTPGNYAPKPEE